MKRYALELHLIEVDEQGQQIALLDRQTTPDVSDHLAKMEAQMEWLRHEVGNALYDSALNFGYWSRNSREKSTTIGRTKI